MTLTINRTEVEKILSEVEDYYLNSDNVTSGDIITEIWSRINDL